MPSIPVLGKRQVSSRPAWSTRASYRTATAVTQRNPVSKKKAIRGWKGKKRRGEGDEQGELEGIG